MRIAARSGGPSRLQQHVIKPARVLCGATILCALLITRPATPQTLARPGWAGSGMTVERWWPHAVFCEITPESLTTASGAGSVLERAASHMTDLQTLGVDALLLRGLEPAAASGTGQTSSAPMGSIALDARFGTLEEFDQLVAEAVRHGIRVVVELRPGLPTGLLTNDARFWLNHGVTGISLATQDASQTRAVRSVLHSYVGERILISDAIDSAPAVTPPFTSPRTSDADLLARARTSRNSQGAEAAASGRLDQPDLVTIRLPAVSAGAAPMRQSLERARALLAMHGPVPLLSAGESGDPAAARPLATALLGSGGAVLLNADDLGLDAASHPSPASIFAWYKQWNGLHRGSPAMRNGSETLLNHDADGALVWVRQAPSGGAPIVAICNFTASPVHLSLTEDIQRLRLRGSFLRTVARSDGGMGAMPLRAVVLPPYAVYVGELSR